MSKTSQREDLDDPEIISKFSKKVRDQTHLNYLYLHTVADICATNPELWNSWKASLLATLYHKTLHHLRRGSEKPLLKTARIKNTKHDINGTLFPEIKVAISGIKISTRVKIK